MKGDREPAPVSKKAQSMNTEKTTYEKKAAVKNGVTRLFVVALSVALEVIFIFLIIHWLGEKAPWVEVLLRLFAFFLVVGIYSLDKSASIKMPWLILIMAFPVLGVILYMMIGLSGSTRRMRQRYEKIDRILLPLLTQDPRITKNLAEMSSAASGIACYLKKYSGYPAYQNTDVTYYGDASDGLEAQLKDLALAEHFIFMEYHAIEQAEAFDRILAVLKERVAAGVEVRIFYDDIGSIGFVSLDFVRRMEALGIKCRVFNPLFPLLNVFFDNRDHRKITVIDGQVGYTGGYNLANEYFNLTHPYGHWKDTGIRLEGDAVRSMTVTFLEMWNAVKDRDIDDTDFLKYLPQVTHIASETGFVIPYADSPLDEVHVGEDVYISIAEQARHYVYYMTPYLIITDEMNHAFCLAARRGVDVRIITPGIPDKKIIYQVTRSYYNRLVKNGVKIYEYTPGFCHAKMCVSDDLLATCGTINLDYRSLYHHFENGCLLYDCAGVIDIKRDFDETFPMCADVTEKYKTGRSAFLTFGQLILRLFAPLM